MKRLFKYSSITLIILSLLVLYGCNNSEVTEPVTVIYSGNLMGAIAPCSCPGHRAGGLLRRTTVLSDSLKINKRTLVVDAGNFASIRPDIGAQKTEILLAGMQKIGLDAIVPSYRDLNNGLGYIENIYKKYQIPFISANIIDRETKQHPFPGHRLISLNGNPFSRGQSIAIIGITNGSKSRRQGPDKGVNFEDPEVALTDELGKISEDIAMIILLSDAPYATVAGWVRSVDEDRINLIISSNNNYGKEVSDTIDGIPYYTGSSQGKHLDSLVFTHIENNKWNVQKKSVYLGNKIASNKQMLTYIRELQSRLELTDNQVGDFDEN